jgi:dienelactone hydrolase
VPSSHPTQLRQGPDDDGGRRMRTTEIDYQADGRRMVGYLAAPDGGARARGSVLICHEAFGRSATTNAKAEALAALGYVAFAVDYLGDGRVLDDFAALRPLLEGMRGDPALTRAIAQAGLDVLLAQPEADASRVAAIGYCFGGTMALELARGGADVKAVVGFHSGLATTSPAVAGNFHAKVLACIGADDAGIPPEQRAAFEDEMRTAGVDWQLHLYGGVVHSFTSPDAAAHGNPMLKYDAAADRRSWAAMLALFDDALA